MSYAPTYNPRGNPDPKLGVNNEPAFEIMDLFYALFRWRWFIIFFTIISAVLSFLAASSRDLEYQAVASVLINPLGINVLEGDINTRTESPDVNIALIESQMRIMESRPVIRQTIKNLRDANWQGSSGVVLDLLNDPELTGGSQGLKSKVLSLIGFADVETEEDRELSVISTMRSNIAVYRPQLGYVVELNYKSNDPTKSAVMANAIAQTYLEYDNKSNAEQAQKAAEDLNQQLENLRDDLRNAEIAVENHKRKEGIVSAAGGLANELEFTQVQQDLIEARNKTAAAKITLESVNSLKESGTLPQNLPEAIRSSSIANLRTQLSQAKQRQISLSAQYLPTHPIMRAAELAVQDAQNSVQAEIALIAEAAQLEYNNALRTERELRQEVSSLTNRSFTTNDDLIELRDLQRDAEAKKAVFESFLLRAGQLGQQANVNSSEAKIVSPASEPDSPLDLPGVIVMAGGTIFGFAIACAIVLIGTGVATVNRMMSSYSNRQPDNSAPFAPARMQKRYKPKRDEPNESQKSSGRVSLLGNIFRSNEHYEEQELPVKKAKRESEKSNGSKKSGKSKHKHLQQSLNLPLLHELEIDRGYMIGEAIPFLRESSRSGRFASIVEEVLSFSSNARTRIVLVTGLKDSYGKSVIASNMALAAYQLGYNSVSICMDNENKESMSDFATVITDEIEAAANVQVSGGQNSIAYSKGAFRHFMVRHMDAKNEFQASIELLKLKEHLISNNKRYDLAFIDAPLLDHENQLDKVAELADEVIIAMPKKFKGKMKSGVFGRLGSKAKRIRGLITTDYYMD